jgi:hypothetical protein
VLSLTFILSVLSLTLLSVLSLTLFECVVTLVTDRLGSPFL